MGLDSLDSIVKDICDEFGDTTYSKYMRTLKNVVRTLRDMGLFIIPNESTSELTVEDPLCVYLPKEAIIPTKVGVCVGGQISEIFYNNDLCLNLDPKFATVCCDDEDEAPTAGSIDTQFYDIDAGHPYYFGFTNFGNLSRGGGYHPWYENYWVRPGLSRFGTYKHNQKFDRIEFSSDSGLSKGDMVLVSYKIDIALESAKNDSVPVAAYNCLKYAAKEHIFSKTPADSARARMMYIQEWGKTKKFYKKLSAGEWKSAIERTKHPSVKR